MRAGFRKPPLVMTLIDLLGGLLLGLSFGCAFAQDVPIMTVAPKGCGPLSNGFGPYDYRPDKFRAAPGDQVGYDRKRITVEQWHFPAQVEMLTSGKSGPIGGDIDYTLRAWPNNHRALLAMQRFGEKTKSDPPPNSRYTVECWYVRAITFAPDDVVVRMLFAIFLNTKGRGDEALAELKVAQNFAGDNPFTRYNLGMTYADLGAFDDALKQAHIAIELGFPRTALKDRLIERGKWLEPAALAPSAELK